jgi:putative transposase
VLTELKNRGVADVCLVVCDGLKGLPESIATTWEHAQVQACILHLIRNAFRYASRRDWDALAKDLRPVYTAPTEPAAAARLDELTDKWGTRYPAIVRLWRSAWPEFIPFLDYDVEIRRIICSTDESVNGLVAALVVLPGCRPARRRCLGLAAAAAVKVEPPAGGTT